MTDIPLSPLLSPQTDPHKEAAKKSWPPAVGNNLLAQSVRRPCGRRKGIRTAQCVCSLFASSLILRNMSHDESRPEAIPRVVGRGRRVPSSAVHSGWMILWAYRPRHFQISPGGTPACSTYPTRAPLWRCGRTRYLFIRVVQAYAWTNIFWISCVLLAPVVIPSRFHPTSVKPFFAKREPRKFAQITTAFLCRNGGSNPTFAGLIAAIYPPRPPSPVMDTAHLAVVGLRIKT